MGTIEMATYKKLEEYIHSYGEKIPDKYKYIETGGRWLAYDKDDVLGSYRCFYYPGDGSYYTCATEGSYKNALERYRNIYMRLLENPGMNERVLDGCWSGAKEGTIMYESMHYEETLRAMNPLYADRPGSGIQSAPAFGEYGAIAAYKRKIDPENSGKGPTEDIRVFPGKLESFPKDMEAAFDAAG